MSEREYLDYTDWLNAGGLEGTGQQVEPPQGLPAPGPAGTAPPPASSTPPPTTTGGKTREQIIAEGQEYDRQHGYIGGYYDEQRGVWVNGSPSSSGPNTDTTYGGGSVTAATDGPDYSQMLPYSQYHEMGPFTPRNATFNFEPFVDDAPFSYETFAPSSYADLEKQPGYLEGQQRLQKQIEAGAAYRGMLRSGMTLGDLWTGLDTNKAQRFADFDNRRFRDYSANRANAFETYKTNRNNRLDAWGANLGLAKDKFGLEYGIDRDIYDRGATENDRSNNYRYNTERDSFADALARWQESVRSLTSIATAGAT